MVGNLEDSLGSSSESDDGSTTPNDAAKAHDAGPHKRLLPKSNAGDAADFRPAAKRRREDNNERTGGEDGAFDGDSNADSDAVPALNRRNKISSSDSDADEGAPDRLKPKTKFKAKRKRKIIVTDSSEDEDGSSS